MVKEIIFKYYFCFLDVFYVVMIQNNGFQVIVSEDEDFDKFFIKRFWLEV